MATTLEPLQVEQEPRSLQVDFSWMKFKALISDQKAGSKPRYIVDFKALKPNLVFRSATNESTFGTGSIHAISINADYEVHGKKGKLEALKRFKTEYSHLSYAYSNSESPVAMTWTSLSDFKTWDFICLDRQQEPVARFSANIWATKKIGSIEFLGPKADDSAAREEIIVTGLTLFYCMVVRTSSLLSFFGAIFSKPGASKKGD